MTGDPNDTPYLTTAEHEAITRAAELWNLLVREVVAPGPTQATDLAELAGHIHAIQHAVMAQAAVRAYPDRYRLLGDTIQGTRP